MSAIIPNTFQVFNIYIDRAMELLTDAEMRVLFYTCRHILGWQNKINSRQGYISLSVYQNGYTDSENNYYGGCGLGRGAIITATNNLVEFGFLERVGKATNRGQKWRMAEGGIRWPELEARKAEKLAKNKERTAKATAKSQEKRSSTSDVTSNVTRTDAVTSDVTGGDTSDVPKENHSQNHDQNHIPAPRDAQRQADLLFDAVQEHVFGIKESNGSSPRIAKISNWLAGKYEGPKGAKVGKISAPAKPEHVQKFAAYYAVTYPGTSLPRDFAKFVEHWREWASKAAHPTPPARGMSPAVEEPDITPMTREDYLAWKAQQEAERDSA